MLQGLEKKVVMIIAGETSGDLHGSNLVRAMQRKNKSLFFFGIGGQYLKEAGTRIIVDASELSVVGITEVFSKIPSILKGLSVAKKLLKQIRPDLLILIDFPDFNLHVAGFAKKIGIPVFYYISPQIWAWRSSRVKKIKQLVDHMAVILPFEAGFYRKHKVPVTYVGHPLMDTIAFTEGKEMGKRMNQTRTIGLLPGSRTGEISRNLPEMLKAAHLIKKRHKDIQFAISIAPSVEKRWVKEIVEKYQGPADFEFVAGGADKVFNRSILVIAVSGTVTLEAAIFEVPMVIIYKVSHISALVGKMMIQVKNVGLANLIAGEDIVPELLQEAANPGNIANVVCSMITDTAGLENIKNKLIDVKCRLGEPGVSDRTADIAINLMRNS